MLIKLYHSVKGIRKYLLSFFFSFDSCKFEQGSYLVQIYYILNQLKYQGIDFQSFLFIWPLVFCCFVSRSKRLYLVGQVMKTHFKNCLFFASKRKKNAKQAHEIAQHATKESWKLFLNRMKLNVHSIHTWIENRFEMEENLRTYYFHICTKWECQGDA